MKVTCCPSWVHSVGVWLWPNDIPHRSKSTCFVFPDEQSGLAADWNYAGQITGKNQWGKNGTTSTWFMREKTGLRDLDWSFGITKNLKWRFLQLKPSSKSRNPSVCRCVSFYNRQTWQQNNRIENNTGWNINSLPPFAALAFVGHFKKNIWAKCVKERFGNK